MSDLLTNATNEYDNVNVTDGVPEGLIHIAEQFAYVPAKKNNIPYKRAVVGFRRGRGGYYPEFSGLCVEQSLAQPILDYFQKKKEKAAEVAEKKKLAAEKRKLAAEKKEKQWLTTINELSPLNRDDLLCQELRYLNRYARTYRTKKTQIYDLKEKCIQYLINREYLDRVEMHQQSLRCRCTEYNYQCDRCVFGIFKVVNLLCFYFKVNEKEYSWHRPTEEETVPFLSDRTLDISDIDLPDELPPRFDPEESIKKLTLLLKKGNLK